MGFPCCSTCSSSSSSSCFISYCCSSYCCCFYCYCCCFAAGQADGQPVAPQLGAETSNAVLSAWLQTAMLHCTRATLSQHLTTVSHPHITVFNPIIILTTTVSVSQYAIRWTWTQRNTTQSQATPGAASRTSR